MSYIQAVILALIEGLTEYLPISSTGHLILASHFMSFSDPQFVIQFNIIVQFGAILSVVFLYWRRFIAPPSFYLKIAAGFLPAALIGLLVKNKIDAILDSVTIVAISLIVGGIVIMWVDRKKVSTDDSSQMTTANTVENLSYKNAFCIGLCQCFAFVPGVSRSGASLIGGLYFGLSRKEAAEFSFFLAVPTLFGATLLKVMKIAPSISQDQISLLILGNIVSFIVGAVAIKTFIKYLSHGRLFYFGIYRVIVGVIFLFVV